MQLCNGDKCLHSDTLIVLCYALGCICFGFVVALTVIFADKRREKRAKATKGVEASETTDGRKPLSRQQSELEEVYKTLTKIENVGKFTGKLEDMLDSPSLARRGSTTSARLRQEFKTKPETSPLAADNV
eukprot:GFUD01140250.1.p1 GENE.GFUD01140250.1~~GFUD01140250.1.p1  ORF type:complete len:130 (-),score=35.23 GFUD01140250.1:69-458(-)